MIWVKELINGVVVDVQGNLTADPAGSVYLLLRRPDAPPSPGPDPGPTPGPNPPPLPDTIVVSAPYEWYDGAYTEDEAPGIGAYLWGSRETSITPNEGESEDEAKLRFSLGVVIDAVRRDYIVSPAGYVYWRDVEKYGILSYTPIMVKRASVYGAGMYASAENGLMVYCEGYPNAGWDNTGRVFSKALDGYDEWSITNEQILEYSVDNCLIAENIPFETDIHTFASQTWLFVINWEGADRFVRVVERTDPDNGEIISLSYDGLYATGESVTLDVPDSPAAEGYSATFYETQTQDGKYKIWLGDSAAGKYFPGLHEKPKVVKKTVEGIDDYYYYTIEPGERYTFPDGTIGGFWYSCRNTPFNSGGSFVLDGKGYSVGGDSSWVFNVNPVYAWSLSPCFKGVAGVPETIYTQEEHPVSGSEFGLWDATTKTFTPTDFVAGSGEGIYSLKGERNSAISDYFSTLKWQI